MSRSTWLMSVVFACALGFAGCGDDDAGAPVDSGAVDARVDSGIDGGTIDAPMTPDLGARCATDADCSDGVFCNGVEVCDPTVTALEGCVATTAPACMPTQVCAEDTDLCQTQCEVEPDADGDGADDVACTGGTDCDDADAARYPGNVEICDAAAHDEDCNDTTVGPRDYDSDTVTDAACCNGTTCGADCDDSRRDVLPGATELCNGYDDNCNGSVDEGLLLAGFADADRDGHGTMTMPQMACPGTNGFSLLSDDCNDAAATIHGGQVEICDSRDNDCDGATDEGTVAVAWYADTDGDAFGNPAGGILVQCAQPTGYVILGTDCNDTNAMLNPGMAERCNGLDDDCNGRADFRIGVGDFEDDDGDDAVDPACGTAAADCNDRDPSSYPGAFELCDFRDNDCNGTVDDTTAPRLWYTDADGDGYGRTSDSTVSCTPIAGRIVRGGDCVDTNGRINPAAVDDCTGIPMVDDDCNVTVDDDTTPTAYFLDFDNDGWGTGAAVLACGMSAGFVTRPGDCAPATNTINPGATQTCTAAATVDEDCDTFVGCDDPDCVAAPECVASYRLMVIASTDGQTATFGAALPMPLQVRVTDLGGTPQGGRVVNMVSTGGAGTLSGGVTTDGAGIARFTVRVGMRAGPETIRFTSASAMSVTATVNATEPPVGNIYTAINVAHTTGAIGVPGPSTSARISAPARLVMAADGTMYVSVPTQQRVLVVSPAGVISNFAGSGTLGVTGDFGPALAARLNAPEALALDETAGILYIADRGNDRVRAVTLSSGVIETYAGGGTIGAPSFGDDNTALDATFQDVRALAVGPDGTLYIVDNGGTARRVRQINPITRTITMLLSGSTCGGVAPFRWFGCDGASATTSCALAVDATGDLYMSGWIGGTATGNNSSCAETGLFRIDVATGAPTWVGGRASGVAGSGGAYVRAVSFPSITNIVIDDAGNLFLADTTSHVVRRVDVTTGGVTIVAGTGAAGSSGDQTAATAATLSSPNGIALSSNGTLSVANGGSFDVRRIGRVGTATPTPVLLTLDAGNAQSAVIGNFYAAMTVRLRSGVTPVGSVPIVFEALDEGAYVDPPMASTSAIGTASTLGRSGLVPGMYRWRARAFDLAGTELPGSPVTFTQTATAPAAGVVFTAVNTTRTAPVGAPRNGPSTMTQVDSVRSLIVAADSTTYFTTATDNGVYRNTPAGALTIIAGTGTAASTGDGGLATAAALNVPNGLVLDESPTTGPRLFVAEQTGNVVRVIDLATGLIDRYAGGGMGVDGSPARNVQLSGPAHLRFGPDGALYIGELSANRIRRVDPVAPYTTTTYVGNGSCAALPFFYDGCDANACSFDWDAAGNMYFSAGIGGTLPWGASSTCNVTNGIVRRSPTGTLSWFGGRNGGLTTEGVAAQMTSFNDLVGVDIVGNTLYVTEQGAHRVRAIDLTTSLVTTVAGNGTAGGAGDYGAALICQLNQPVSVAGHAGHLYIGEFGNRDVRVVW